MSIRDYLKILRDRWVVIVVAVVLGVGATAALHYMRPAEYTADLSLYVSSQTGDTPQAAYQGAQLSSQRVKSYTELVSSTRVTSQVVERLGLQTSAKALSRAITAQSALDSVIIDVQVTDTDPEMAARIANATGEVFADVVAQLERPTNPTATAPVAIRIVEPSVPPTSPSSNGLTRDVLPGLLIGLLVGVSGALLWNAVDTSVKNQNQLQNITGVPTLGMLSYDPKVPREPLTVFQEPMSPRAEAFRQVRTNLQFIDADAPPQVVAVTSATPGEGKSTSLANLALTIASNGQRVLVIDADLRRPTQAGLFGLESAVGLTSVLFGKVAAEQAIQRWDHGGLDILTSGTIPPNPSELLASQQMRMLLTEMRKKYDMILIDCPPLLPVTDAAAIAPSTDGVVLMCRARRTTRAQLESARKALDAVSARLLGAVLTMNKVVKGRGYGQYGYYYSTGPQNEGGATELGPSAPPPSSGSGGRNPTAHSVGTIDVTAFPAPSVKR